MAISYCDNLLALFLQEDNMGRKASKATDNPYYIARIKAAEENDIFTSREKAATKLGIERSRLARIELDQIDPYAEEVDIMATAYNNPHLCTDYCNNVCPVGMRKLETQVEARDTSSIERLVLKFLSSTQCMEDISKILISITEDGKIDKDEIKDLQDIFYAMDSVAENIEALKCFVMKDPKLRPFFHFDLDQK